MFGREPSPSDLEYFDSLVLKSGAEFGPTWLSGDAKDRVIQKILKVVEILKPYHKTS